MCKSRCYQEISLRMETAYKQPLYDVKEEPKATWDALMREYSHVVSGVQNLVPTSGQSEVRRGNPCSRILLLDVRDAHETGRSW